MVAIFIFVAYSLTHSLNFPEHFFAKPPAYHFQNVFLSSFLNTATGATGRYRDEMKHFMDEILSKHNSSSNLHGNNNTGGPTSAPGFSGARRPFRESRFVKRHHLPHPQQQQQNHQPQHQGPLCDRNSESYRDTQMEHLYDETKRIQASLLADIKKLSKCFSEQRIF